jgi:hypothetical protein
LSEDEEPTVVTDWIAQVMPVIATERNRTRAIGLEPVALHRLPGEGAAGGAPASEPFLEIQVGQALVLLRDRWRG